MLPSNRHFVCKIQSKCIDEKFFLASQSALSDNSFTERKKPNKQTTKRNVDLHKSRPSVLRLPPSPPVVRPGWGARDTPGQPGSLSDHTDPTRGCPVPDCHRRFFPPPFFMNMRMHESKVGNGLLRGSCCHLPPETVYFTTRLVYFQLSYVLSGRVFSFLSFH